MQAPMDQAKLIKEELVILLVHSCAVCPENNNRVSAVIFEGYRWGGILKVMTTSKYCNWLEYSAHGTVMVDDRKFRIVNYLHRGAPNTRRWIWESKICQCETVSAFKFSGLRFGLLGPLKGFMILLYAQQIIGPAVDSSRSHPESPVRLLWLQGNLGWVLP